MRCNVCRMGIINFFSNIRWKIFFCSPNGYFKFMYITQNTYATLALSPLFLAICASDFWYGVLSLSSLPCIYLVHAYNIRRNLRGTNCAIDDDGCFGRNEGRLVLVWIKRQESVSIKNSHQWHIVLGGFIALTSVDLYIVWLKQERIEHNSESQLIYARPKLFERYKITLKRR